MTLAQQFVDFGEKLEYQNRIARSLADWAFDMTFSGLSIPRNTRDIGSYAEKFIFDQDAAVIVKDLVDAGSVTRAIVHETSRAPAERFWVEYPCTFTGGRVGRTGIMVISFLEEERPLSPMRTIMIVVGLMGGDTPVVHGLVTIPEFPMVLNKHFQVHFFNGKVPPDLTQEDVEELMNYLYDLVDCLFLINTPRVSEFQQTEWHPRKQRARVKGGKPPLIEVKRVMLNVGVAPARHGRSSEPGSSGGMSEHHKRLHRVIGHFRTYRKRQETPVVSFVPPHWRGDPDLGIILHERNVHKQEEKE